jgi:hypothetical protein
MLSTDRFWSGASAAFFVLLVIFIVIFIIVTAVLSRRPTLGQDDASAKCNYLIVKSLINSFDLFSTLFFWYLFWATGYWFIFFKLQERVYCFLPE